MALNDDLTIATPDRMIGGAGPFDFSGESDTTAVPITTKIDNETAVTRTIDVSTGVGSVDESAVTVAELLLALNTAWLVSTAVPITASDEAVTGRLKLASNAGTPSYIQVYGRAAEIALLGQGKGLKFIKTDTLKSFNDTPTQKEEETFTTTDAGGIDTEILTDGYRKGFTASVVDAAEDWELLALIEGGTYNDTTKLYEVPTSNNSKIYFTVEVFYSQYAEGTNKEADLVGYVKKVFRTCKGAPGDTTHERGFADGNYTVSGTSYKDESDVMYGDSYKQQLTVVQYEALDVYNV